MIFAKHFNQTTKPQWCLSVQLQKLLAIITDLTRTHIGAASVSLNAAVSGIMEDLEHKLERTSIPRPTELGKMIYVLEIVCSQHFRSLFANIARKVNPVTQTYNTSGVKSNSWIISL